MITIECSGGCGKIKQTYPSRLKNGKWICKKCNYKNLDTILKMTEANRRNGKMRECKETHFCKGGCGKSKTANHSYFKNKEWRCVECTHKDSNYVSKLKKQNKKEETHSCSGGCGKVKTAGSWYFKNHEWWCHKCIL
jgi:hypothetical protein